MSNYYPPFTITPQIINLVSQISEQLGRLTHLSDELNLNLRRINRIRTIHGSLAIEGNTLSEQQITAVLDGKHVIAPPREIQEVRNAMLAYDGLKRWQPANEQHLLEAHQILMTGLIDECGTYRQSGVGVMSGKTVVHMAPPAKRVPILMDDLLQWVKSSDHHPLILGAVFHYEFEFIHPFADGNGRMGRLWQSLILKQWHPLFADLPIESLIHKEQKNYYQALQNATNQSDSACFIEFILTLIHHACDGGISGGISGGINLSEIEQSILSEIKHNPQITHAALAKKTHKSLRTVERHIKKLRDKKIIQREGSNKTGFWCIKETAD
ncbi:MAG: Fic family protein [Mariprofundaceae bacterium]|nr:Fic family protein [Mariprofundaceae bacterium]